VPDDEGSGGGQTVAFEPEPGRDRHRAGDSVKRQNPANGDLKLPLVRVMRRQASALEEDLAEFGDLQRLIVDFPADLRPILVAELLPDLGEGIGPDRQPQGPPVQGVRIESGSPVSRAATVWSWPNIESSPPTWASP
jgi:hypothetical protein